MKKFLSLIGLTILIVSCKNPPEPTVLYEEYRKSVVLIQNSYYFHTSLDNGLDFYYNINNDEPVFYEDEEEAIQNAAIASGTGFFISKKGEIATNRHVVFPLEKSDIVGESINEYLNDLKYKIRKAINDKEIEQSKIVDLHNEYFDYLNFEERSELKDKYNTNKNEAIELERLLYELDFDPDNTKTELVRVFLGVAYDDTHVTDIDDYSECVATKKSLEDDIDLAIIQLKDKTTPVSVNRTFELNTLGDKEALSLNDPVYMIAFNHGESLASTAEGIKSQFTQGTVTQDPDQNKILYSIPTLPGSSGGPIIDQWGNLVAINFAKTGDFQGFSFGIPVLALNDLYNNKQVASIDEKTVISRIKNEKVSTPKKALDYSNVIREFLIAEQKRDFDAIYSFFSPKFSRYYDITEPTFAKLKNRYEYLWGFTSNSRNYIQSIEKINNYTYDLKTNYKYFNERKGREFSVHSTVRFLFDSNGKIVETYGVN
ncbi:trypsin-like peptidase domain-containing protein [Aureitalea sp. L0-47]|uniref:S1 family peptidase n=1 Tax=Aureitalea sp. L0-47 TaxID=2816962 RepID=UPI0022381A31|nr:serine protease [Aureitalea sp. L0-47]MCW5521119.1 trypsin-like peptidase domain-containing protein [Aureitalea sp. L0-47]